MNNKTTLPVQLRMNTRFASNYKKTMHSCFSTRTTSQQLFEGHYQFNYPRIPNINLNSKKNKIDDHNLV